MYGDLDFTNTLVYVSQFVLICNRIRKKNKR